MYYEIEDDCVHKLHLYNQGIEMCEINANISEGCDKCPFRIPGKHKVELTTKTTWIYGNENN